MATLYTQVGNEIVPCEPITETKVAYNLTCICSDSVKHVIRVKSECFTSKKNAISYFKRHAA